MTDYTVNVPRTRPQKASRVEYGIYFALIFIAALPFAAGVWLISPALRNRMAGKGPVARALAEARAITPMIFQA